MIATPGDLIIIYYQKTASKWVWLFNSNRRQEAIKSVLRCEADPQTDFTHADAEKVIDGMKCDSNRTKTFPAVHDARRF